MVQTPKKSAHPTSDDQSAAKRKPSLARVIAGPGIYREQSDQNQTDFWARFGTIQSAGSRYETGRAMPRPLKLLITLEMMGVISPEDLARAQARLKRSSR